MTALKIASAGPLVAALADPEGRVQGVQVTLLTAHGAPKQLRNTAPHDRSFDDAYVRIDAGETLVVAEACRPRSARRALGAGVWAFLSAENLAQFEPPPVIDRLIIAADNDEAGLAAAARLRARVKASIVCEVALPPGNYPDWNDWARAEAR